MYAATTEFFQFPDRLLIKSSVFDTDLPRKRHLSEPSAILSAGQLGRVPVLHPADHDAPSVLHQDRCRRIEVDAVVDRMIAFRNEPAAFGIKMTDQTHRAVAVVVFKALRQHILRADEQYLFPVEIKIIRAFPHQTETAVVFDQYAVICPFDPVRTAITQKLA